MVTYIRPDNPSASWLHPDDLANPKFQKSAGSILLGRTKNTTIYVNDNRHVVTIAGSRAGKSATSLMSNLLTWEGSTIVVDPKGELATNTAKHRADMGQDVFILDPFNEVKGVAAQYRKSFNPLSELMNGDPRDIVDDAATLADALITSDDGRMDHWAMAAKNLIRGLCLYALHIGAQKATLTDVRQILTSPLSEDASGSKTARMSLMAHFKIMMGMEDVYGGALAGVGATMHSKPTDERGSILSTAIEQTAFLDSLHMKDHLEGNDLPSMRILKQKPTTIYLVLPSSRMATHFRWLRMILTQAMTALEREPNATGLPVLFILEEFPTLGYMRLLESSAGLMAGYDVKLWTVLQDLSQLQAHYPKSWETFLGNAGIVEAFGNTDSTTLEYLSKRLGSSLAVQVQPENASLQAQQGGATGERETIVNVPLLAPFEIAQAFERDKQNKLVMLAGKKPFALNRIYWEDMLPD